MARGKILRYDDERLIAMLADGRYTHSQIARALELSRAYVGKIARGERRPEIRRCVRDRRRAAASSARDMGVPWLRPMVAKHIRIGMTRDDEVARKCREFILSDWLQWFERRDARGRPGGRKRRRN